MLYLKKNYYGFHNIHHYTIFNTDNSKKCFRKTKSAY